MLAHLGDFVFMDVWAPLVDLARFEWTLHTSHALDGFGRIWMDLDGVGRIWTDFGGFE